MAAAASACLANQVRCRGTGGERKGRGESPAGGAKERHRRRGCVIGRWGRYGLAALVGDSAAPAAGAGRAGAAAKGTAAAVADDATLGAHRGAGAWGAAWLLTHAWHAATPADLAFAAGAAA